MYLAALRSGSPALLVPGDNPAHLESADGRVRPRRRVRPVGRRVAAHRAARRLRPRPAPRPGPAADHVRVDRLAEAGAALPRQPAQQRRAASPSSWSSAARPGDRRRCPCTTATGCRSSTATWRVGAGLVLTDLSVVDACFWELFAAAGATSFAGVPYTFDLLDHYGFGEMELPSLRYVTQAGGRLAPERVARYAQLGRERGWDFYVMYGQTEATARMAYLPPASRGVPSGDDRRPGAGRRHAAGPGAAS